MSSNNSSSFKKFVRIATVVDALYAAVVATLYSTIVFSLFNLSDSGTDAPATVATVLGTACAWLFAFVVAFLQGGITIAVLTGIVVLVFAFFARRVE